MGSTIRMSRGLNTSLTLLPCSFSKRLNNTDRRLRKGLASFSPAKHPNVVSQRRELHQLSSLFVTPDRPSVDEQFQLEVGPLVLELHFSQPKDPTEGCS